MKTDMRIFNGLATYICYVCSNCSLKFTSAMIIFKLSLDSNYDISKSFENNEYFSSLEDVLGYINIKKAIIKNKLRSMDKNELEMLGDEDNIRMIFVPLLEKDIDKEELKKVLLSCSNDTANNN